MNDIISVGNTPIFEQLVREMASRGKHFESLLSPRGAANLKPVDAFGISAKEAGQNLKDGLAAMPSAKDFMAPGAWMAKPVPVMTPEEPKIEETFDPAVLEEQAINPHLHVQTIVKKFTAKWPNAAPVHITRLDNLDGTVTIKVTQGQTDKAVNADPKSAVVKQLSEVDGLKIPPITSGHLVSGIVENVTKTFYREHPEAIITSMEPVKHDDGSITMKIEAVEPKKSIGEDTADALYMKPSAWGSDEE